MKSKRRIAMLLFALLLSLTACGGKTPSGRITTLEEKEESTVERESLNRDDEEEEEEALEEETEEEEEEAEEDASDEDFSLGVTGAQTYTNEFFDLKLELDEEWMFATEEEVEQVNSAVVDSVTGDSELAEAMKDALDSGSVYIDVIAYHYSGMVNTNITISKMSMMERLSFQRGSYIEDMVSESGEEMVDMYENAYGMDDISVESSSSIFLGKDTPCLFTKGSSEGTEVFMRQAHVAQGNYLATITVTSFGVDYTEEVLEFYDTIG